MRLPERITSMAGNVLVSSLKRAFRVKFWLASLLVIAALSFDSLPTLITALSSPVNPKGTICVHYFYFNAVSFGGVFSRYFIAILAAIPFSLEYIEEYEMFPYILSRTRMKSYAVSKMLSAALSGGLALAFGGLLFILALSLKLPLMTESRLIEMQWIPFYNLLVLGNGIGYFVACIALLFLNGFLWGGVAMCVSAHIPNKFVVIAAPFVLSFLLVQICRLLRLGNNFRLDYLLTGRAWLGSTTVTIVVPVLAVVVIWGICCVKFTQKLRKGRKQ